MKREKEREIQILSKERERESSTAGPKRGGKHIAAYHHSGITVVTQHATERAIEREKRERREREELERKRERARERERRVLVCGSGVLISIRCA